MSKNTENSDTSRIDEWQPGRPYNSLPKLPPSAELESKEILKECIKSRTALAELKGATSLIPNPSVLINTLPVLEAKASSEIENIVTTGDNLFRYMDASRLADPATREAERYRGALLEGFQAIRTKPIGTTLAEAICTQIRGVQMAVRRVPGTTLSNQSTGEVIYTPPENEMPIRELLANWERFLHEEEELDPLIRLAVGHYQFEAIHPFTDGNGRTGRILNSLYLVEQRLLDQPVLYLSRYILEHRDEYYRRLLAVTREAAWEPWILYVLRGVTETSHWTTSKIEAIRQLMKATADHVQERLPKIYTRELIEAIFEQPYCRIEVLVRAGNVKRETASKYLKALVSIDVLREESRGREKLFINSRMLGLLTRDENNFAPFAKPGVE